MLQRDQFELLSAYLDGEVTAVERRQVEDLLSHDEQVKQLYSRLLKLRSGFQGMPLAAAQPMEKTVAQVMARLDRRPAPRRAWVIGLGAVAATAIGAMTGLFGGPGRLGPQFALQQSPEQIEAVATVAPPGSTSETASETAPTSTRISYSSSLEVGPEVAADALMIAIDQPILDMGMDEPDATPLPDPDAGVN